MVQILIAEDNVGDIELVQEALQEHKISYKLHIVRDGAKALAFLASMGQLEQPPIPDLVLLDINLPKADGSQVLAALRKCPGCATTPVIVVTSSDAQQDRNRMAKLGISHYFKKPLDFDAYLQLGAIVRRVIEERLPEPISS